MSIKMNYDSFGNSIEGTDYSSGVETFAQNLIEDREDEASIIYPAPNSWIKTRSETYLLTTNTAKIILPQKIYKLKHVFVSLKNVYVFAGYVNGDRKGINAFTKNGQTIPDIIDISFFCADNDEYGTLSMETTKEMAASAQKNKQNTVIWTDNYIDISMNTVKGSGWFSWALSHIEVAIISELLRKYGDYTCYYYNAAGDNYQSLSDTINQGVYTVTVDGETDNSARLLNFRVEYIPLTSDIKLRARKQAKTNEEYIQPINQRAEINSASALGKFMYNTAQKMGTEQITLVKFYTKIGDIPPLGCRVKHNGEHYILTANSLEITNSVQVKVTHTLSKNWSNKSQYVSVDQKYRNYKIPADILWRNMHWEDYIEITTDGVVENAEAGDLLMSVIDDSTTKRAIIPRIFICDKTDDVTITSFFLYRANRESYDWGVTVPCTTIGMANSMVFSASMKDNLSAGLRISEENNQYCEEVFYCEKNGKLDYARAVLSGGINITDAGAYPQATLTRNTPTDKVFDEIFYISKDPGEALKFTYQCHWISADNDIVIGSKLAENHPLVKKWTENRKFRFLALRKPLRQGEDKVRPEEHMDILILTDEQRKGYFGMQDLISDTQKAFKLMLVGAGLSLLNNAGVKAWAITDENYNLYIGCNDKSKTTLYFSHIHERI